MSSFACHHCSASMEWSAHNKIGRRDSCSKCGWDLHVCKNCKHQDPSAHRECRESIPERVNDKEKSNFCDLFSPFELGTFAATAKNSKENLLSAAEALFKKKT